MQGTIIIMLFVIFSSMLGYAQKLLFAKTINVADIGLFFSVLSFVTFFSFLRDLGLSESLVYFIPRFIIKKSKNKIKSSILFTVRMQVICGILISVFFVFSSGLLAKLYFKDPRAQILLIALAVYFVIEGFLEALYSTFHAYQNMVLYQGVEFCFQLLAFLFFLVVILNNYSIYYFGLVYVIGAIITSIIFLIIFLKKIFPGFFSTPCYPINKIKKRMISYSIPTMTASFAFQIFGQQTIFFLTYFVGLDSVGYYVMAMSLAKATIFFLKAMIQVFFPMMSELWEKKDIKGLNYYFSELITYSYLIAIPASLTLFLFSEEILRILYAETFVKAAFLLRIFAVYFLFYSFNGIMKRVFLSKGLPKEARNITYITVIANIILNIVLIPSMGLLGAGLSDLMCVIIGAMYTVYLKNKYLEVRLPIKRMLKILMSSLFFVVVIIFLKRIINVDIYLKLLITLFVSGCIYLVSLLVLRIVSFTKINRIIGIASNNRLRLPFFKFEPEETR